MKTHFLATVLVLFIYTQALSREDREYAIDRTGEYIIDLYDYFFRYWIFLPSMGEKVDPCTDPILWENATNG